MSIRIFGQICKGQAIPLLPLFEEPAVGDSYWSRKRRHGAAKQLQIIQPIGNMPRLFR